MKNIIIILAALTLISCTKEKEELILEPVQYSLVKIIHSGDAIKINDSDWMPHKEHTDNYKVGESLNITVSSSTNVFAKLEIWQNTKLQYNVIKDKYIKYTYIVK
jgi:hypothetical protein